LSGACTVRTENCSRIPGTNSRAALESQFVCPRPLPHARTVGGRQLAKAPGWTNKYRNIRNITYCTRAASYGGPCSAFSHPAQAPAPSKRAPKKGHCRRAARTSTGTSMSTSMSTSSKLQLLLSIISAPLSTSNPARCWVPTIPQISQLIGTSGLQ
jgi:hypothetical protein